jgi:hypothetical protein
MEDTQPPLPSDTAPPIPTTAPTSTRTLTPTPTNTPLPTKTFDTLAQQSGIPASIQIQNVSCNPRSSSFTILINHQDIAEVPTLTIVLKAVGTDATFTDITPTSSEIPIMNLMVITRNGIPITFSVPTGTETFEDLFRQAWAREEIEAPKEFGMYWVETGLQPNMGFHLEATYVSGGVTVTIEWTNEAQQTQARAFDYKIC